MASNINTLFDNFVGNLDKSKLNDYFVIKEDREKPRPDLPKSRKQPRKKVPVLTRYILESSKLEVKKMVTKNKEDTAMAVSVIVLVLLATGYLKA